MTTKSDRKRQDVGVPKFVDDRPRDHHYVFAHRELPVIARKVGAELVPLARSGRMHEALAATWQAIGERLPEDQRVAGSGLSADVHELSAGTAVLVWLPAVEHAAEAHFAAIVFPRDMTPPRYVVLEHGWTSNDEPRTVLGEWNDRGHVNYGDGPTPDAAGFLAAVDGLLTSQQP